jgi:Family of unknown function (DUF6464)
VLNTLIVIIVVTTIIFLICSRLSYYQRARVRIQRQPTTDFNLDRRFYKRITKDPEEQYVEGIGIVIGDLSCTYNARSPYIRCAINPDGLCQDCRHYQKAEE